MPQMKSEKVSSKKKVVAVVQVPVFDSKNPDAGFDDILSYDFRPYGFNSAKEAVVSLVTTQLGTNIKNKAREQANPKLTKERLRQMALKQASSRPTDLQAAIAGDPTNGLENFLLALETEIQKQWEEEQKARAAALPDTDEADEDEDEE